MILIDNMEMPKNCAECRFWSVCRALSEYPDYESILTNEIIGDDGKRHSNCPLHEVTDPDTVSRQAVLDAVDALTKWSLLDRFDRHVGVGVKYYEVQEAVKALPPSPTQRRQAEPQWIPCSNRLPKLNDPVYVTTAWGEVTIAWRVKIDEWFIHDGIVNARIDDVIAWIPLPQPYKGAEHE